MDAEQLRSRLLESLEAADRDGHKTGAAPLRIVVIGGGPTGVETAGAIADLFQRLPDFVFKDADLKHASVTLINRAQSVIPPFTQKAREYTSSTPS